MTTRLRRVAALAMLLVGIPLILSSAGQQQADARVDASPTVTAARRALIESPLSDPAMERMVRADHAAHRWEEEKRLITLSDRVSKRNLALRFMTLAAQGAEGDLVPAVRNADLLLRQRGYEAPVFTFLRDAAAFPTARTAIAARLAQQPPWRADLLVRQRGLVPSGHADAVALLAAVAATPAPPTATEIEALAALLVARGDLASAAMLRRQVAPHGDGLLLDPLFARRDSDPSGLIGWTFDDAVPRDAAHGLPLGSRSSGTVVTQLTFAPPGTHRLRWRVAGATADTLPTMTWTLRCLPAGGAGTAGIIQRTTSSRSVYFSQSFALPQGCIAQRWTLLLDGPTTSAPDAVLSEATLQ